MKLLTLLTLVIFSCNLQAHTWDEPWHKEVVTDATSFGLYEVSKNSGAKLTLKLKKHIAGKETKKKISVSDFYNYEVTSSSSTIDHHDFSYKKGQSVYALLKGSNKKYAVSTPTSGIDVILDDGSVAATFRHTLHQTQIEPELYEMAQKCIFNSLHNEACDKNTIERIVKPLEQRVAILSSLQTASTFS